MVSGWGTGRDRSTYTQFRADVVTFDQCLELARGDDMAARAAEELPKEARRKGYDIVIQDADEGKELSETINAKLEMLGADQYLQTAGIHERVFGGGAVLLGVNDGTDDLTEPLDLRRVSSLDFLTVFEPRELIPLYGYADPRAPKYGQIEIYQLVSRAVFPAHSGKFAAITMQIHESRLLIFPGLRMSRYQVMSANAGWGDSIFVRLWRVLRAFNEVFGHVEALVGDFAQAVYKLKGFYDSLAEDADGKLQKRLQTMDMFRSTIRALVLDAEDSFERQSTSITGIPDVMREFAVRLAAAADMPLTRLFGTSPAGMNATGESDIAMWDDRVSAYQRDKLRPHYHRLVEIIMHTELKGDALPEKWDVKFRPLRQMSEKELAAAHQAQSMADMNYVNSAILSPEEVALSRFGGTEFSYDTHVDFTAREKQEQVASPPVTPEETLLLQGKAGEYVPPPPQGSATAHATVAPPGPAAAPDPNTPPVPIIQSEE
jgi:phage-related protein (TIGR01555 family)